MAPNPVLTHIEATYFSLRRGIGVLGIALPFVLSIVDALLEPPQLQGSMSAYYYTRLGDVFVATLGAVGVFLVLYRSYSPRENAVLDVAGVCAIGVALFPTDPTTACGIPTSGRYWAHPVFAATFFAAIAYVCIFLSGEKLPPSRFTTSDWNLKATYQACGVAMTLCIAAALGVTALGHFYPAVDAAVCAHHGLFWFESSAVVTFGVYWLAKSREIDDAVGGGSVGRRVI
jgi:hypothetical protein